MRSYTYEIIQFVSDFFLVIKYFWGSPMLYISVLHSFLLPSNMVISYLVYQHISWWTFGLFPFLVIMASLLRSIDCKCIWVYFWILSCIPLIDISILMPISHMCFDYYSYIICFKIGKCECSNFILVFQDCFGYLSPLHFHINFRISLYFHAKKKRRSVDTFIKIVDSVGDFGDYCHLYNINSSNPWTWDVFPFI